MADCLFSYQLIRVLDQLKASHDLASFASGFWTEEVRASSDHERIGFDIVTLSGQKAPLARRGKGSPAVGPYAVDVPSIEAHAVAALALRPGIRFFVIDEIGKMELKCPPFYPAVQAVLDAPNVISFGTVPVPSYGHKVAEVEAVKSRADVHVIKVTKGTRDGLVGEVAAILNALLSGEQPSITAAPDTAPPAAAPAQVLKERESGADAKRRKTDASYGPPDKKPSAALVLDAMPPAAPPLTGPTPRALLLGESASPTLPGREDYSERSLWGILDRVTGAAASSSYRERVERALSQGIAVWDVSREVHLPKDVQVRGVGARRKGARNAPSPPSDALNDLPGFLRRHPSVRVVVFNGTGAEKLARRHFGEALAGAGVRVVTVPSSSRANTAATVEEKVQQWRDALIGLDGGGVAAVE